MSEPELTRDQSMTADLTAWGKAITLETSGRRSGEPRRVTVGFLEEPSGALLVAASAATTHWALNLRAEPRCHVEHDGIRAARLAELLDHDECQAVVIALILKYGTPAERLGGGPAFRLVLVTPDR